MADAIDLDELRRLVADMTPGPWMLATSNSWRRIMRVGGRDGDVLCPTIVGRDRHEDIAAREEDLAAIIAGMNALPSLLARLDAAAPLLEAVRIHGEAYNRWLAAASDTELESTDDEYRNARDALFVAALAAAKEGT